MSLGKAWWNHVIYGWKDSEKEPTAVKTPGPLAFALAIAALVAFFALPSVHEGFGAVVYSWRPYNNAPQVDYQRMAREAEANRDAKTLALLSMRMISTRASSVEDGARLADEAVAMDPSLTWIYYRGASGWYAYHQIAQKHGWVKKLEEYDPDNATPYLVEASIRDGEIRKQYNYLPPKEKILNDPAWRAAMEKAFAAPRYDSYYDRAVALEQSVLKAHNLRQPSEVSTGIFQIYPFGFWESQKYSKLLLDQAKEAEQKGDKATAAHLAWTVVRFAERARDLSRGDLMRATAETMLLPAYEILQPLEAAAGHTEVAKLLAIEKEDLSRKVADKRLERTPSWFRPLNATSIALHSAGMGVLLFGGALVLSALFLLMGRFAPGLRTRWTYRWACNIGRFAPACLVAAIGLMAAVFAPYLDTVQDYFKGVKDPATLQAVTYMESSLYELPYRFFKAMTYGLFWEVLLATAIIGGILFLSRNVIRLRAPRVNAA